MSKIVRNIFVLSLLILTAGMFCILPSSFTGKDTKHEITAEAEDSDEKVDEARGSELVSLFDSVATASVTLGTTSLYGHETVYQITSAEELAYISYKVATGDSTYQKGVYSLEADIDLLGSLWTPIGTYSYNFLGTFYGNGHTISNITINDASVDANSSYVGLFGHTSSASIMDIRLAGSMVFNTTKSKGTLVGCSRGSEIINCHDESSSADSTGESFKTIGYMSNKTHIFWGGSYDGLTANLTTNSAMQEKITWSSTDNSNTTGYVGFYNLSEGDFYRENSKWYNSKQVRVLLSLSLTTLSYTPKNNLYQVKIPCLREKATSTDIYPLKEGYKASIGTITNDLKVDKGYIKTIQYTDTTISVYLNYGYGVGRSDAYTFKYDQTFASFFMGNIYMKTRAGYTYEGLYSPTGKMETERTLGLSGYDYKNCYPVSDLSVNYSFKWKAQGGQNVYFNFAIASDEGGVFTGGTQLGGAIDSTSFEYSGNSGILSNLLYSSEYKLNISNITSGDRASLSFKLNDGYTIKALTNNASRVVREDTFKADQTSGVYVNFLNFTGTGKDYFVFDSTNNDSYNPATAVGSYDEATGLYTINVDNIVGKNGEVYIIIARTEYEVDLTPLFTQTSVNYTHYYDWKIVDGDNLVYEIAGAYRIGKPSETVTVNGVEKTLDRYYLFVRKYEAPTLQITTVERDENGNKTKGGDAVIIAVNDFTKPNATLGTTDTMVSNNEILVGEKNDERFEYAESVAYADKFFYTWNIITDDFIGNGFIQMLIGAPQTFVTIRSVGEDGQALEEVDNMLGGLGTSINGGSKNLNNSDGYFVSMNAPDMIIVTNNGYYMVTGIKVVSKDGEENLKPKDTPIYDSNGKITGETSVWNEAVFFADIYTGQDFDDDGKAVPNYVITITYKVRTYDVNYEYYFGGVKQTNIDKLFSVTTKMNGGVISTFTGLTPSTSSTAEQITNPSILSIGISLTQLAKGVLYVPETKFKVAYTINGTTYDDNNTLSREIKTFSKGYLESQVENNTMATPNGQFDYNLTLGTFDTTVRFYFEYREVAFTMNGLYVYTLDETRIDSFSGNGLTNRFTVANFNLTFKYDFAEDRASLNGDMIGLSIHSQYYLFDWYLENGSVRTNCANYGDLKTNSLIIADIVQTGAGSAGSNDSSFSYSGVEPLVKRRVVSVKYATGSVGNGRFYLNDQETVIEADHLSDAGSVTYGEPLTLSNDIYYNLGYTFNTWTTSNGGFDTSGKYFLKDDNWYSVYRTANNGVTPIAINYEGYQTWKSLSNTAELAEGETRTVNLVATWNIINYAVSIDIDSSTNRAYASTEINIGDAISYLTYPYYKDGKAYYTLSGTILGTRSVDGRRKDGYVVTGYEIAQEGGNALAQDGAYLLTPDNFLEFISEEYRFVGNRGADGAPIVITTLRDSAKYILKLANSANGYYSYTWNESKNAGYGEFSNGEIQINITFDAPVTNLTDALANGALSISRTGYVLSGWAKSDDKGVQTAVFDPTENYDFTQDIYIAPMWELVNNTVASGIAFTEEVGETRAFYLTNSQDILVGSFSGANIDEGDKVTNSSLVLNNGEKVDDYGYIVTIGEKSTTYSKEEKLNIDIFSVAGEVAVKFYVTIKDSLSKLSEIKYTVESEEISFNMVKNNIYFYEYDLHSIYNGTSEFVPASEGEKGANNNFGSFLYRYDWNGADRAGEGELTAVGQTEKYFNNFLILGSDFNAGSGKSLRLGLNLNAFGQSEWNEIFDNVQKDEGGYYAIISPNEVNANGLTIEKAKITITFPNGSSLYIEGVQTIVHENTTPSQFAVGKQTFTYNYLRIKLVYGTPAGEYRGSMMHSEDEKYFVVEGLVVDGHSGQSQAQNFEWNISESSKFTLINSEDALRLQYLTRYLVAQDGGYNNGLTEVYEGLSDGLKVSSIKVGDTELTLSDKAQYSVFYGSDVIMSIAGNDSMHLFLYLNKDILSKYTITFTISVSYLSGREAILYPLAWGNGTSASAYINAFDSVSEGSSSYTMSASTSLTNSTTYAVLTDVVKVNLDYNGGKRGDNFGDTLYLSYGDTRLDNPIHEYAGLSFAGYANAEDNLTLTTDESSTLFTISKGGLTQNLKAKWTFDDIVADLTSQTIERYASESGVNLKVEDIADITSAELFTSKIYTLVSGEVSYSFNSTTGEFEIKNASGYALPSMSGEFALTIDYTYSDGITAPQRQTKTLTFTFNILVNTIAVSPAGDAIVYSNSNKASSVFIDFTLNGEEDGSTSISDLSKIDQRSAEHAVYIKCAKGFVLKQAGDYDITFTVVSAYSEMYQFENNEKQTTLTITIEKFEIKLADYSSNINPSKVFGQKDPTQITTTITVNQEEVKIAFTREGGEGLGEYALYFSEIVSDNSANYSVNSEGFEGKFKIVVPSGNLKVEFDSPLTYTYNGYCLTGFTNSYNGTNYTLSAMAGGERVSTTYDLYYEHGNNKVQIPDDQKEEYALVIEFSTLAEEGAGNYFLSASLTEAGSYWNGVDIVNKETTIVISKRTITVTAFEKVFDQGLTFIYNNVATENNTATLTLANVVSYDDGSQDEIEVSGTISSAFVGNVIISDLAIINGAYSNYDIVLGDSLSAKVIADTQTEITASLLSGSTFDYGDFTSSMSTSEITSRIPLEFNAGKIDSKYISITSAVFEGATYSHGGYLNSKTYEVTLTLSSTNFTFGGEREEDLTHQYSAEAKVEITIDPISLTITNSTLKITKVYDGNAYLLTKFVGQAVNASGGYYTSTNILEGDVITIESASYADSTIGTDKEIILTFADDDDSENYAITTNVVGDITKINLTFLKNSNADAFEFVDGEGEFGNTGSIKIDFTGDINVLIEELLSEENLLTRVGYKQVGWEYEGVSLADMTTQQKENFLAKAVESASTGITLDAVWEIAKFKVVVQGENATASITEGEFEYFSSIESISVEAGEGYTFVGISANNENATLAIIGETGNKNGAFSLTQLLGDITITILTKEIEVKIIIEYNAPAGESVTTDDANWGNLREKTFKYSQLSSSDLPALRVNRADTYSFSHWTLDGQTSTGESIWERINGETLTTDNLDGFTFTANWTEAELALTITASENAEVVVKVNSTQISEGENGYIVHYLDNVSISIAHADWYKWAGLEIDGSYTSISGDSSATGAKTGAFTLEKITSSLDITIVTEAIKVTFATSYQAISGGTITEANGSITGVYSVDEGMSKMSDILSVYTASAGTYEQEKWVSGTADIEFTANPQEVVQLLYGSIPTSDITLNLIAKFKGVTYTVTFVKGSETGAVFTGEDAGKESATRTYVYGEAITNLPILENGDKDYIWRTDANEIFSNGKLFTTSLANADKTITVTADWDFNLYNVYISVTANADKVISMTAGGLAIDEYVQVDLGGSQAITFTLESGYEIDTENTVIASGSSDTTLSFNGNEITIVNVRAETTVNVVIKVQTYTITLNETGYENFSISSMEVQHEENIADKFSSATFSRGGYILKGFNANGVTFATLAEGTWSFSSTFVQNGLYTYGQDLTLDAVWEYDEGAKYITSTITAVTGLSYNGKEQTLATANISVGSGETFAYNKTFANGDKVKEVYYLVDGEKVSASDAFAFDYQNYLSEASVYMVAVIQDAISGATHNILSNTVSVGLDKTEVVIKNAIVSVYYTGSASANELITGASHGSVYFADGTACAELEIAKVEIIDPTGKYNQGSNYEVKYYFNSGAGFNENNYEGLTKEGGYYTLSTADMSGTKVYAQINKAVVTITLSGMGFENGSLHSVDSAQATIPDYVQDAVVTLNSIVTKSATAGNYNNSSQFDIDWAVKNSAGETITDNFRYVVSGSYTIRSSSYAYAVTAGGRYLTPSALADSDCVVSVTSVEYGGEVVEIEEELNYMNNGELIFSISSNGSKDLSILVATGKSIKINLSVSGSMAVVGWTTSEELENALLILQTLEEEGDRTYSASVSAQTSVYAVVTDYKAVLLDLGDRGGDDGFAYIKLGSTETLPSPEDWTGFDFAGWYCEDGDISINVKNATLSANANITASSVKAIWVLAKPKATPKTFTFDARIDGSNVEVTLDDILTNGIENQNQEEITYSYEFLKGSTSLSKENTFEVAGVVSSSGNYTLKVTASKEGYGTLTENFTFNIQVEGLVVTGVTLSETTLDYQNKNFMSEITALLVGTQEGAIALSSLTEPDSPYCYFTFDGREIKNAGTYTLTLHLDGEVFDLEAMADDFDYAYEITINKVDLIVTQEDIPADRAEKLLGMDDPDFTFTIEGVNEENIEVTLTRVAGESQGEYPFNGITSPSQNYNLSIATGVHFTIKQADGSLKVVIEDTLTSVYSGSSPVITAEYDSTQGIWTMSIGDSTSNLKLLYQSGEDYIEISGNLYSIALENISFSLESAIDAGEYDAENIAVSGSGNFATFQFEGKIQITTKPLTISNITKTFDRNANIIATESNLEGLIAGDKVSLSGRYRQERVGEDIELTDLKLEGEDSGNYHIASVDVTGDITPMAVSSSSLSVKTTSFVYGQLGASTPLAEILSLVEEVSLTIDGVSTDIENGYVEISGITFSQGSLSNAGMLKIREQTLTVILSSDNFAGLESGYAVTLTISEKELDLSVLSIVKDVDGSTALPSEISSMVSPFFFTGDKVEVDMDNSGYEDANIGSDKKVTILLKGEDSANYKVLDNILGKINAFSITLEVNATTEHIDLVTDGKFVDDGLEPVVTNATFKVGYPAESGEGVLEGLTYPQRTGYTATGWKYFDGTDYILLTAENILSLLESISNDAENTTNRAEIYVVWEIDYCAISIAGDNIASYEIFSDNLEGNHEEGFKVRYFSDIEIDIVGERGYKIKSYLLTQGNVGDKDFSDVGKNTSTIKMKKVASDIALEVTMEDINITFNIDFNLPSFTQRIDTSDLAYTFGYSELESRGEADLGSLAVTEGTYYLAGFVYNQSDLIGDKSLKEIVDTLHAELDSDATINLTASWQGESYQILFDENGGTVNDGSLTITATYGRAITEAFPDVAFVGQQLTWKTSDGTIYKENDILQTIGERVDGAWTLTLTANWASGAYKLTIEVEDKIIVRVDGEVITSGSVYDVTYGVGQLNLEATAEAGYSYLINKDSFKGSLIDEEGKIVVKDLTSDSTLIFEKVCKENTLKLTLSNVASYSVNIDGEEVEARESIIAKTESEVIIVFTVEEGYKFSEQNVLFTGNGKLTKAVSDDFKTLTIVWSEFVGDADIEISAIASDNVISVIDASAYILSLTLNGQSVDVTSGTFTIKTGEAVEVKAVLKYGYEGGAISTGETNFVKAESEKNEFNSSDKYFHYSVILEGFKSSFSISFSAVARTYAFEILVQEGQEDCGEITSTNPQYVKFGEKLILTEKELRYDYIFEAWLAGGRVISNEKSGEILIDESMREVLESATHGDLIKVYASYIKRTLDVTFSAGANGGYEIVQNEEVIAVVEANKSITQEILLGQDVILRATPFKGYEVNGVSLDDNLINLADYGYTAENNQVTIYQDIDDPIYVIKMSFKAGARTITVQAGTRIRYQEYLGTSAGGFIYATDSRVNKLDESVYLENNGNLIIGADYKLASYTDIRLYFLAEAKAGFSVTVSCDSSDVVINQVDIEGRKFYSFSGIKEDITIKAIFIARENTVNVQFALEGEKDILYAGMIAVDSSSSLVSASPNRASSLAISVVTGGTIKLEVFSSLAYSLLADESGYLRYEIVYNNTGSAYDTIKVGNVVEEDREAIGYSYSSSMEIENVNADATIYIYVEAQEYTIKFAVSDIDYVIMPEKVKYGKWFSLSSLTEEQINALFPTRDGFTFAGYFTHPLGQGNQYINGDKQIMSAWLEDGFEYNGSSYVAENGFDPDTNTFTLYSCWVYDKASLEIQFLPPEVTSNNTTYNITDVVTNMTITSVWTDQTQRWYAEVALSSSLTFKALTFDNYEFVCWKISFEGGDPVERPASFTLSNLELGHYVITAVYNPCYRFIIESTSTGRAEGGRSEIVQDGRIVTGKSYDKEKIITLRAIADEGYTFIQWVNLTTGEVYEGTRSLDNTWTYTFTELVSYPLQIKAVFTGKTVAVDFDASNGSKVHSIRFLTLNGKKLNYLEPFNACVGDEIVFSVRKSQGYGFELIGAPFTESFDSNTEYYTFRYTLAVKDLTAVDRESYSLNILFNATKEKLNLSFTLEVDDAVDTTEKAKAGELKIENAHGDKFDVKEGTTYQIEYGDVLTLIIEEDTNYRLAYIYLKNPATNEVTSWVLGNELVIDRNFIDAYYARNIAIEVYFERLVWTMEEFRANTLVGQGSEENPFKIYTAQEFAYVAYLVNNGIEENGIKYSECYFELKADIDFQGRYWEPIGTEINPFNGSFDLGGYDIRNVTHYKSYSNPKTSYGGLFWHIGKEGRISQENNIVGVVVTIVGIVILVGIILILIIYFKRKKDKEKLHKIANK